MFYNPFMGFRDPNDPYGLQQASISTILGTPQPDPPPTPQEQRTAGALDALTTKLVPTTRFSPDGRPLDPNAPPPTPPRTVVEGAPQIVPGSGRVPEAGTTPELDYRKEPFPPTSRKVPEVRTPIVGPTGAPAPDERLVPTPASTAPAPETWQQQFAKLVGSNDFSGAAKALSAMFPKKPPAPPPFHVSGHSGGGGGVKDLTGQGQQILSGILKGRKAGALVGGDLGPRQKQPRQDDPHKYEQERFDFRRRSRR
jgi:hypothetical protein